MGRAFSPWLWLFENLGRCPRLVWHRGFAPRVSRDKFPPTLTEQRRIVAKVDKLMAFVGALETQPATARAAPKRRLAQG